MMSLESFSTMSVCHEMRKVGNACREMKRSKKSLKVAYWTTQQETSALSLCRVYFLKQYLSQPPPTNLEREKRE